MSVSDHIGRNNFHAKTELLNKEIERYKRAVKEQTTKWLVNCLAKPTKNMRDVHIAIIEEEISSRV
jgi:hypothetical protein